MTKLPATDSAAYINAQLLNDVVPVRPLDLFQAFRKADLAAADQLFKVTMREWARLDPLS